MVETFVIQNQERLTKLIVAACQPEDQLFGLRPVLHTNNVYWSPPRATHVRRTLSKPWQGPVTDLPKEAICWMFSLLFGYGLARCQTWRAACDITHLSSVQYSDALRGARAAATHALAAAIARAIALMALAALGLSGASFHETFHAGGRHHHIAVSKRSAAPHAATG